MAKAKQKKIKAWMIVNKDFYRLVKIAPRIVFGEVWFIENLAKEKIREKPSLKIVPIEIRLLKKNKKR